VEETVSLFEKARTADFFLQLSAGCSDVGKTWSHGHSFYAVDEGFYRLT
jgi:hypothetical protein